MGHCEKPKLILGPFQRLVRTALQQWKWNTCPHSSWIDGADESASVKQIMHMSSASWVSFGSFPLNLFSDVRHFCCKQGKHFSSLIIPPHKWPQECIFVQALAACSWHCWSTQTFPTASSPVVPVIPQKRHTPIAFGGSQTRVLFPLRNSSIPLRVFESTSARSQNNLARPQLSCSSTRIASSSSLQTCKNTFYRRFVRELLENGII